jgi:hypothetical protein
MQGKRPKGRKGNAQQAISLSQRFWRLQWCDSPADTWQRACEREGTEALENPDIYTLQTADKEEALKSG